MKPNIAVIGSSNTDMVIKSKKLPAPGETIIGEDFMMNPGGKGANQAIAAVRLGGNVTFVGKTGNDMFGRRAREHYRKEGIITDFIALDEVNPSGVALIMVNQEGENCISVASGANGALNLDDIENARDKIDESDIILLQLEIPISVIEYVVNTKKPENKVILNPAPAQELDNKILKKLHVLTPNISEAEILTGIAINGEDSMHKAASKLRSKGVENVIITLGKKGAFVLTENTSKVITPPTVEALDSTAAGDTFNGALAVALGMKKDFIEATKFANKAAALSVQRMGAQVSIPTLSEI